ncbi:MAG: hypothetical protein V3W26_04790 [Thermodesulfobacteriota bacterium]
MFTLFFNPGPVKNYQDTLRSDLNTFSKFHQRMLKKGIYLPPSQFEAAFVSLAHTEKDIEKTLALAREVFKRLYS